ncbi:MAG: hypothetical protein HY689_10370 [Chloroflexi bacterium]|nr:hypothetical protein [Chloroflexota bacterium]
MQPVTLLVLFSLLVALLPHASVSLAAPAAPVPTSPPDGTVVPDFTPTVAWNLPPGTTQYQLQVVPANNDGPGLDLIRAAAGWYTLPAPPHWYGLLPDLTYSWRVRASAAPTAIGPADPSWGPWSEPRRFRTPPVSSASITLEAPVGGVQVPDFTPLLRWQEANPNAWYYEVQLSKDPTFTTDPQRATAAVYWELRHGGVTDPPRSYRVPEAFPLEEGQVYYWRVRPRVQGDGTPVPWSPPASFRTGTTGALGRVSSTAREPVVIANTLGVALTVPPGAVALDAAGNPGAIVFSIERNTTLPVSLPPEASQGGAAAFGFAYTFGPAGVPLERPVRIQLPVPPGTPNGLATLYRYDLATGSWVNLGGEVESQQSAITATVYQFSTYLAVVAPPETAQSMRLRGPGKVLLRNQAGPGSEVWLAACIEAGSSQIGANVLYGAWNEQTLGVLAAPAGTGGWPSAASWVLPQGSYRLLLTRFSPQGTAWTPWPGNPVALRAWQDLPVEVDPGQGEWTPGRAPCAGPSLAAVSTGEVQVTLAWAGPADLDLAVTDPAGETVWFGNPSARSGGRLDRDTHCGNFQMGRPENVFWPQGSAPRGRYRVAVTYYRDCGDAPLRLHLAVRILLPTGAHTVYGSLTRRGEEREVARFEVP